MQGAGVGLQGVNAQLAGTAQGMQGSQIGLSAADRALAAGQLAQQGANTSLAGTNQVMQGAQVGLQGVDRQLAGTNQAMQGAQVGLQGVDRQLAGSAQGMQGAQIGLQGVAGAQAGYGITNQASANMANMGTQQLAAQNSIYNTQNQIGGQQQAQQQAALNQQYQDFLNQRNYPYQQLAFQSDMLRGLPLSQTASQMYAAPQSALTQVAGGALVAKGLGAFAKGGRVKAKKQRPAGLAELAISKMA
jgi:hypothetical protein